MIEVFGQVCTYKLFRHKAYLVVPKSALKGDLDRLESLCITFGIGLVRFEGETDFSFESMVRPSTGYSAYSPDVPGCAAAGDTEDETRQNFRDALVAHFDVLRDLKLSIPEPAITVQYVEVPV